MSGFRDTKRFSRLRSVAVPVGASVIRAGVLCRAVPPPDRLNGLLCCPRLLRRTLGIACGLVLCWSLWTLMPVRADGSATLLTAQPTAVPEFRTIFDGRSLAGWNGDAKVFRVEEEAVVGGQLQQNIPHNFFLEFEQEFSDFELTLELKLVGKQTNAGIQLRSRRIPDHHEMIGYQADLGQEYWGCLYDESRRRRVLARPDPEALSRVLRPTDWNSCRILCQGRRIQYWINDFQTVDYHEEDASIEQTGKIALQIHGGPPGEAWYRHIRIRELKQL